MPIKSILDAIYPILSQNNTYNIILANGEFPRDAYLQSLLSNLSPQFNKNASVINQKLICCDGAIENLINHPFHREPDYIIGDGDSITATTLKQYATKFILVTDQSTTDLTKASNLAKELHLDNIIILGATGLREDHTLANISLLNVYASHFNNIALISDYGIFTVHTKTTAPTILTTIIGQQISLFTVDPSIIITCEQLKWPLQNYKFNAWHNGTLNQATDTQINISMSHGQIVVFRAFNIK